MIRLLLGLIYLVLLFGMPLLAEAQIYDLTSYRSNGGLPDNHVYAIFQDHEGYIWFGTDEGVSRYDGKNYLNINEELIDSPVRWIFEDKSFNIWILTRGGISRYDGKAFTHYTKKNGLADDEARAGICTRDGHIWIGTKTGLSKFNGTSFESYNRNDGRPIQAVWNMFEDHEGVLWLALRGGGLLSYDGKNFKEYTKESGLRTLDIFSITEDSNHTLWLATAEGLCRYDKKTFKHFTTADGLADNRVNAVVVDRHQRVWCSTFGGGLSRLQDGQFVNFNHLNGLPDNYLMALTQDYEGNIWAGTRRRGAFKFGSEQFTSYSFSGGDVSAITQAMDGTIWLSLPNNGLYSLDSQGQTRIYTTADGLLQEESIWTVYSDSKDRVWAGGEKGIYCYQKGNFKVFALKEIAAKVGIVERITTIIEDSEGKIWFGSNSARSGGALVYDGEGFRLYSSQHGLIYNQIESFALDRNKNLWICTDNGLSKFDGTAFTNFIPGDTFPDKRALCAHEDELGQLWVGTSNGLCKLTQDGFKVYGLKDGLPSTDIRTLISSRAGLWIGTSQGVSFFDGKSFRNYSVKDGLLSNDINIGACLKAVDGGIWFGTNEGVARYYPAKDTHIDVDPRVFITGMRVQDKGVDISRQLSLSHKENTLTFEFIALSFVNEDDVKYSFYLEGFDTEWSQPTDQRVARYTNLPPRDYKFYVKMISPRESKEQTLKFIITPPYWKTWWFTILLAGLAVGLIRVAFRLRVRRLEARHRERLERLREVERLYEEEQRVSKALQELNKMKTNFMAVTSHELRTPLTILKGHLEMMSEGFFGDVTDTQKTSLETCDQTLVRMSEIISDINEMMKIEEGKATPKFEDADLVLLAEEVIKNVNPFVEKRKQKIEIEVIREIPLLKADREKFRQIFFNLIQNAIKFTPDGGSIKVLFNKDEKKIKIVVEDSGVGIENSEIDRIFDRFYAGSNSMHHQSGKFEFNSRGTGLGLAIVKSYIEAHKGTIWAESEGIGKGSRFYILLPLDVSFE